MLYARGRSAQSRVGRGSWSQQPLSSDSENRSLAHFPRRFPHTGWVLGHTFRFLRQHQVIDLCQESAETYSSYRLNAVDPPSVSRQRRGEDAAS
jgi:hypothetical protein